MPVLCIKYYKGASGWAAQQSWMGGYRRPAVKHGYYEVHNVQVWDMEE